MDFNEYQEKAGLTAIYPNPIVYPVLGLAGEAGEVAEKVKKVLRDCNGVFSEEKKLEIAKELGDVLWYLSQIAKDLGVSFNFVAETNLKKLEDRQNRGKIQGSGDNR